MKPHILLVDDDKDELIFFLDALKDVPTEDGFKCSYASSGKDADQILKSLDADFIFADFNMPEVNGLEFIGLIRKRMRSKKTKIFLYSVHINEKVAKAALTLGASGVVTKKNTIRELTAELKSVFSTIRPPAYVFSGGAR